LTLPKNPVSNQTRICFSFIADPLIFFYHLVATDGQEISKILSFFILIFWFTTIDHPIGRFGMSIIMLLEVEGMLR
jgi:hypothetical protein